MIELQETIQLITFLFYFERCLLQKDLGGGQDIF